MRESAVERSVCAHAKSLGWLVLKLSGPNLRGQPDRMFLKSGRAVFVEFKAPGKRPTALQAMWIRQLTAEGFVATYVDNAADGKKLLEELTK